MSEHKHVIKFDVKTYPCKCGLEFSQELAETLVEAALSGSLPTVQLGIDLEFEKRKVAELKAFINQLIEAGNTIVFETFEGYKKHGLFDFAPVNTWQVLVKDWLVKERER